MVFRDRGVSGTGGYRGPEGVGGRGVSGRPAPAPNIYEHFKDVLRICPSGGASLPEPPLQLGEGLPPLPEPIPVLSRKYKERGFIIGIDRN